MSWSLLERFFQSELFNNDPSLAVGYLSRYANHVGIQYVLCQKLRQFAYEEIEFFLPQLCHLLVSEKIESMALEEFLIDLCQESVSGALLTFWLFQTHLHDLSSTPQSPHFKTCRRIFNKIQAIVFGSGNPRVDKIRENVLPTSVFASIVLAAVAVPFLPRELGPLAIAEARKPRQSDDTISDAPSVATGSTRLARSHTVSGPASTAQAQRAAATAHTRSGSETPNFAHQKPTRQSEKRNTALASHSGLKPDLLADNSYDIANGSAGPRGSTTSLPDFPRKPSTQSLKKPTKFASNSPRILRNESPRLSKSNSRKRSAVPKGSGLDDMSPREKVHILRSNYFRSETQFLSALESISTRLVVVPKPARLSALRAELALLARDLPAEVDIPLICPATLDDGIPSKSKHHRIVRINPAEATSLNSAERVPFLLMVELLREDFDFNPDSEANQRLLAKLVAEGGTNKRRLFDITAAARETADAEPQAGADPLFGAGTGDLSSPTLLQTLATDDLMKKISADADENGMSHYRNQPARMSSGNYTASSYSISTPGTSDVSISRSGSPGLRKTGMPSGGKSHGQEQPDISALATHIRTAAQMLAQLELSGSKRPRHEVEAIKAKIIASMQSLEEQSFNNETAASQAAATFDSIMANVRASSIVQTPEDLSDEERMPEPGSRGAGAARMENDQKLAGVRRKGDRDDPSAATFGEEWNGKKDRVRRSSPFGWMQNWDLLSVIVKTGSDLRQEMFACQLIRVCSKIWEDAKVPVWIRQMKILVTGESSGLIETITNGVSLHSLKRSLTLSNIDMGNNPRRQIATLKDHFIRTFGEVDTPGYKAAADCFMRSLAAYSILSYVLQLKDRHNGNMLIDNVGHIIHIDFGFMLSNSPGSVGFEAAPFKLTYEYVDVLGGVTSTEFESFKSLCKEAFQALRKSADNVVSLVEMMGKESKQACFASGAAYATTALRQRFCLHLSKQEAEAFVEDLIAKSLGSYYTRLYDNYQYRVQGIY